MGTLLQNDRIRQWGLVAHTVATFLFVTIFAILDLHVLSISYVDNREFPGLGSTIPAGPFGESVSNTIRIVPNIIFILNSWLTESLLVSFVSKPVAQVSDQGRSPVLLLLGNLCYEQLGHCLPVHSVPRCYRYVLKFFAHLHATSDSHRQYSIVDRVHVPEFPTI